MSADGTWSELAAATAVAGPSGTTRVPGRRKVPYKEFQTVQKPQWGVLQLQLDHIERMLVLGPMCESWNSRGRMHYFNENHLESASQASQTQPLQVSLFVLHMIKAATGGGKELALTLTPSTFSRCGPTDDVWICPSDGHDKKRPC
jgi:hypothetical protein